MYSPANIMASNSSHVDEFRNACFAMLVQAVAETKAVPRADAERRAVGIWCTLHGLFGKRFAFIRQHRRAAIDLFPY